MKKIFLIIGLTAVMSNACGYGSSCEAKLERIATALERIANSMEKQQIQAQKDTSPKKIEITHLNGRSLKAVPTTFIEAEFELTCEEKCDSLYFYDSQIKRCLELNCKGK